MTKQETGLSSVFTVRVVVDKAVVKLDVCIPGATRRFSGWSGSEDQGGAKIHVTSEKAEVTCRDREISGGYTHFLSPPSAPHNLRILH